MKRILLRRGLQANLPILSVGEAGFATDTGKLYIGNTGGNVLINTINGSSGLTEQQLNDAIEAALTGYATTEYVDNKVSTKFEQDGWKIREISGISNVQLAAAQEEIQEFEYVNHTNNRLNISYNQNLYDLLENESINRLELAAEGIPPFYRFGDSGISSNFDGNYLAIAYSYLPDSFDGPKILFYKRNNLSFDKLNININNEWVGYGSPWNPAVNHFVTKSNLDSGYTIIYKYTEESITELLRTSGTGYHDWSPDGNYLLTSNIVLGIPVVKIYKRTGDSYSETTLTGVYNNNIPYYALPEWSQDSQYITFTDANNSTYLSVYKKNGEEFLKLENFVTLPIGTSNVSLATFSPNNSYFILLYNKGAGQFVTIYEYDGTELTPIQGFNDQNFSHNGNEFKWTNDEIYFITYNGYLYKYNSQLEIFGQGGNPFNAGIDRIKFSPDGQYISVVGNTYPYISVYSYSSDPEVGFTKILDLPNIDDIGVSPNTGLQIPFSVVWGANSFIGIYSSQWPDLSDLSNYNDILKLYSIDSGVFTEINNINSNSEVYTTWYSISTNANYDLPIYERITINGEDIISFSGNFPSVIKIDDGLVTLKIYTGHDVQILFQPDIAENLASVQIQYHLEDKNNITGSFSGQYTIYRERYYDSDLYLSNGSYRLFLDNNEIFIKHSNLQQKDLKILWTAKLFYGPTTW
jgi:hypothetical protein